VIHVGPPYPGPIHHRTGELMAWVCDIRNFGAHGGSQGKRLTLDQVLSVWLLRSLAVALDAFWADGDQCRHECFARAAITPILKLVFENHSRPSSLEARNLTTPPGASDRSEQQLGNLVGKGNRVRPTSSSGRRWHWRSGYPSPAAPAAGNQSISLSQYPGQEQELAAWELR
jgi:hypothetical protein